MEKRGVKNDQTRDAQNEKHRISETLRRKIAGLASDSEEEDDRDVDSDDSDDVDARFDEVAEGQAPEEPTKGLMALKFMKAGAEKEKQQSKEMVDRMREQETEFEDLWGENDEEEENEENDKGDEESDDEDGERPVRTTSQSQSQKATSTKAGMFKATPQLRGKQRAVVDEDETPTTQSTPAIRSAKSVAKRTEKATMVPQKKKGKQAPTVIDEGADILEETSAFALDDGDESTQFAIRQRELIQRAFAHDDVVEQDFLDEKGALVDAETNKEQDITLPGWVTLFFILFLFFSKVTSPPFSPPVSSRETGEVKEQSLAKRSSLFPQSLRTLARTGT